MLARGSGRMHVRVMIYGSSLHPALSTKQQTLTVPQKITIALSYTMNTSRNLFTLFCSRVGSPNPIRFQVLHSWSRDLHLSSHHEAPIGRLGSKVPIGGASSARVHGTYSLPFRRDREWAIYKLKLYISGLKPKSIETVSIYGVLQSISV